MRYAEYINRASKCPQTSVAAVNIYKKSADIVDIELSLRYSTGVSCRPTLKKHTHYMVSSPSTLYHEMAMMIVDTARLIVPGKSW